MSDVNIYRNRTDKPLDVFIVDLTTEIEKRGFGFYHLDKSDLAGFYRDQGVEWPETYRHVMLQLCKPESSGKSMQVNPERSVFIQKFFFIYHKGGKTEIRFLSYSSQLMAELLGHNTFEKGFSDDVFGERMASIFAAMQASVEAAI
ncbi:MAG: hypothetical protein BA864_11320 [Desulfuromonadales bacterium C00003093]|nr:MAG: hypothetical protein BA864_11320 [Desulfuromonadales bacterium C00003093]